MRRLHLRLLSRGNDRDDVAALVDALQGAGHVVTLSGEDRVPDDVAPLPEFVISDGAAQPVPESLAAMEARHIRAVLEYCGGNRSQAAALLGVARSTLLAKLRRYRLG